MPVVITKQQAGQDDGSTFTVRYAGYLESDPTPASIDMPEYADRSVQVFGTFGGGTVVIEGSNDGTNWETLTDPQGNALSITARRIEQIQELTAFIRPRITAGTGVNLEITFLLRRASSMRT